MAFLSTSLLVKCEASGCFWFLVQKQASQVLKYQPCGTANAKWISWQKRHPTTTASNKYKFIQFSLLRVIYGIVFNHNYIGTCATWTDSYSLPTKDFF